MTTPAKNVDVQLTIAGQTITYRPDGTSVSSAVTQSPFRRTKQNRPASTNTPRPSPGQIRNETTWNHSGMKWSIPPMTLHEVVGTPTVAYRSRVNNVFLAYGTPAATPFSDALFERVVNGALEKLKGQDVNVALAIAERKKTGDFFASTITKYSVMLQRFKSLKRGKLWDFVRGSTPGVSELPAEWLQLQYGAAPLLMDIDGACKELAGVSERDGYPNWIEVTKSSKDANPGSREVTWIRAGQQPAGRYLLASITDDQKARAVFRYAVPTSDLQKYSELGLTNPLSVAYEMMPYSFVLDWALPVGNWINLLDADLGWVYLNGSVSRLSKLRHIGRSFPGLPSNFWLSSGSASNIRMEAYDFQRYRYLSPPKGIYPTIKNPFQTSNVPKRVTSALALLAQKLFSK